LQKDRYGRKTTVDYIRMLYISYGSVCELETPILLAGDLGYIEKGELGTEEKGHCRNRKNVKSADNIFRKQTLESLTPCIFLRRQPQSSTPLLQLDEKNLNSLDRVPAWSSYSMGGLIDILAPLSYGKPT
jgi:hypothetical protein